MSEKANTGERKTLGLSRPGKLELRKTVEGGQIRQSFSHGRSKSVQVEVKKKRTFKRGTTGRLTEVKQGMGAGVASPAGDKTPRKASGHKLTGEERAARARALEDARQFEEERLQALESTRRAEEEARRRAREEAEREAAAAAERAREEERAKEKAAAEAAEAARKQKQEREKKERTAARPQTTPAKPPVRRKADGTETETPSRRRKGQRLSIGRHGGGKRRGGGKLTVVQALTEDERQRSLASMRRAREREKRAAGARGGPVETRKVVRDVVVPEAITVQELANRMAVRGAAVVKSLMKLGVMATINDVIDADTAELVVNEFGHRIKRVSEADVELGLGGPDDSSEVLRPRPPVVTVMGHVDHGKTSLLDALRNADVASGEAGGITQHIGAYQVETADGRTITFIDTPGHAAFTAMRQRGANITDIVVLVVAADDGVMPQTAEAIQHAQAAGAPIIIAINKIDRPDADAERVRKELLRHNIVVEELGGEVLSVPVSATRGTNLDKLIEAILLQSELMELSANPDRDAEGVVVEARLERGRGVVATVLVTRGALAIGDIMVAGSKWGRVRALIDDRGRNVEEAGPSQPVEMLGLSDPPEAGDEMVVVANDSRAREVTEYRHKVERDRAGIASTRGSVEQMFSQIAKGEAQELPLVVKTDVRGSLEAILSNVESLTRNDDEIDARILLSGVGGISESDVTLAAASNAIVIGFNVRADAPARQLAKRHGVEVRYYRVIYELLDDLRAMLSGMLAPTEREETLGYARIKEIFDISRVGRIAGCEVVEGIVRRGARARLLRDNVVVHEGAIGSLKHHKEEVGEVRQGFECGIGLENYQDLKPGDRIEAFTIEQVARELRA